MSGNITMKWAGILRPRILMSWWCLENYPENCCGERKTQQKRIRAIVPEKKKMAARPGRSLRLTQVEDREAMTAYLLKILQPEDVLLLKASNGMNLSEVAKAVIG